MCPRSRDNGGAFGGIHDAFTVWPTSFSMHRALTDAVVASIQNSLSFGSRDEEEVGGYAKTMSNVFESFEVVVHRKGAKAQRTQRHAKSYPERINPSRTLACFASLRFIQGLSGERLPFAHSPFTENHIEQLHGRLLRYSTKDGQHRGKYKKLPNNVEAFNTNLSLKPPCRPRCFISRARGIRRTSPGRSSCFLFPARGGSPCSFHGMRS